MIGSRAWRALMRRNVIYRRRNIIGSFLEFILPIAFVGFLVLIKNAVEDSASFAPVTVPQVFPSNEDAMIFFSFSDYVTSLQAGRKCMRTIDIPWRANSEDGSDSSLSITGIYNKGYNWQVPFVKCNSRLCREDGQDAFPFCEYLALGVAPSSKDDVVGATQAEAFREYIYERYPVLLDQDALPFDFEFVQMFDSDNAVVDYVTSKEYMNPKLALAIVFDGTDTNINYNYKIRVNSTGFNSPEDEARPATITTPPTDKLFESYVRTDSDSCPDLVGGAPNLGPYTSSCTGRYMYNGALTLQRLVHDFIMEETGAKDRGYYVSEHGVQFVSYPTQEYVENGFYAQIGEFAPLLITLGLLYPVAAIIRYIVLEKELRQKELLKMMSVKESDIGWSWFIFFFVFHALTALGAAAVSAKLYEASSPLLLFFFWEFTMLAVITFCFFLASLFSKATRATLVGLLIFFVGFFLTLVIDYQTSPVGVIFLVSIHPVGAFAFGIQEIGRLEDLGVGLTIDTISQTDSPNGYTFANTLSSCLFDALLWGIASWYTNRVVGGDFGRPMPWYFPFTSAYWFPGRILAPPMDDSGIDEYPPEIPSEPVSTALKEQSSEGQSIEIRKLRKVYGEKIAVDDLTLSMYSGQVTALLGHNGAGKTTTINMLTGMTGCTGGYATVKGKDIRTQMDGIRQGIGICLQHDCLFPELNCREHLQFFSRIKGLYAKVSRAEAEQHVDDALQDVALSEKRNTFSKNLSGGMKRKLSVAIAFCGGSKTVLLDEPTSGMDPFARRFTWNLIRRNKQDRCIILTTHFMDEADILGDRVAIMSEGQLRCVGSSLFLKKTYGVGYQLTIEKVVKKEDQEHDLESEDDELESIVMGSVEEAALLTNVGTEISFQLPLGSSSSFTSMFDKLDDKILAGSIVTYGVSITTLDEVFLLVARGSAPTEKSLLRSVQQVNNEASDAFKENEVSARSRMDLETEGLFFRHVGALFQKRALSFKRDKKAWCCTTILPSAFVLVGFLLYTFVSPERELTPLVMDLSDYNANVESKPANPIPFNSGGNFSCQPGKCAYEFPVVTSNMTDEVYYYCGAQSYIGNSTLCSFQDYEDTVAQITEAGAQPVGGIMADVSDSSYSLFETATGFAATQYGGIFYAHDLSSVVVADNNSASIFDYYFDFDLASAITDVDIENLGPLLESFGINITNLDLASLADFGLDASFLEALLASNANIVGSNYSEVVVSTCLQNKGGYTTDSDCERYAGINYVVQYNFTALHVAPLYQMLADTAIVREALDENEFTIQTVIHPLPITAAEESIGKADDAFSAWFLIILGFPFISGSFATFVVQERQSKAKHLQTVAGVKPWSYWLSTWLWDVANYQIPCWITVALMFIFSITIMTTTEDGVLGGVLTVLLLYGPAAASFSYCVSYLFSSPSVCNLFIIISGFIIGFGGTLATFILRLIGADPANPRPNLTLAAEIVEWCLRFFPAFNLARGLYSAINLQSIGFLEGRAIDVWDGAAILYEVIFLAAESVIYLLLAMKIDEWSANPRAVTIWRRFIRIVTCQCLCDSPRTHTTGMVPTPSDDDVVAEEERVLAGKANDDLIVLSQLTKIYDNGKKAVDSMSLGVPPGQCFGLLGINGAGKTTTMQMLTAEFPPTSGDATLAGYSVANQPEKTRRRVGYCPQFDAHIPNLSGFEHVELYASIKGVPSALVKEAASYKLAEVGLSESDGNLLAAGYSGGMKRRLSLATATIGAPQIVFLDECSTGVDPVARREIWEMISKMVSNRSLPLQERPSVVLTTHSMEECEALCPRIGIMAGGKLRCLGSAQHLKSKFGQGYQVELKVKHVELTDGDYTSNVAATAKAADVSVPEELDNELGRGNHYEEVFLDLEQTTRALFELTGDAYLTNMLKETDPTGYAVFKEASSPAGIDIDGLAEFATTELRMRLVHEFVMEKYPNTVVRERQDTKIRFEIGSDGIKIGEIFAAIEEVKDRLNVAEYGVSQTSLEQVFNQHAAEAERQKEGTNDG